MSYNFWFCNPMSIYDNSNNPVKMISNILNSKVLTERLIYICTLIFIPISFVTCKSLYETYVSLTKHYEEAKLFKKRHNCVVMYRNNVIVGWPPTREKIKSNILKGYFEDLYEPILYFIDSAEFSLDIAFMTIHLKPFFKVLKHAKYRGVKVRVLLNYVNMTTFTEDIKDLVAQGIEVMLYISPDNNMASIMHNKYMVKDFNEGCGYVFTGSPNITDGAFLNNFEDMLFISSNDVVTAFHDNFQSCWDFVKAENETLVNKVVLADADLL